MLTCYCDFDEKAADPILLYTKLLKLLINIPILPVAFLTFAEAKVGAPPL